MKKKKKKKVTYGKYGYLFIAPFFITYLIFQLYPLISTFYYSTLSYYKRNGREVISFAGIQNFLNIFGLAAGERAYVLQYLKNTLVMWGCNFVPQILVSLLMAVWLTDTKVKIKGTGAIKVIIYLPSVITAASVSVLFKNLFSQYGPITLALKSIGLLSENFDFMSSVAGSRGLISLILWWMWYGNTSILLISGVLGIDPGLYEAADIDGVHYNRSAQRPRNPGGKLKTGQSRFQSSFCNHREHCAGLCPDDAALIRILRNNFYFTKVFIQLQHQSTISFI